MTRHQFYIKHRASILATIDGTFATVSALADLRKCAAATDSPDTQALAAELDQASAQAVRMLTKIPPEFIPMWITGKAFGVRVNNATTKETTA